jgi:hypothetical protein
MYHSKRGTFVKFILCDYREIFMKIEVTAMRRDEKEILVNLLEKYEYELSQYFVHYVNDLGLYNFENLDGIPAR